MLNVWFGCLPIVVMNELACVSPVTKAVKGWGCDNKPISRCTRVFLFVVSYLYSTFSYPSVVLHAAHPRVRQARWRGHHAFSSEAFWPGDPQAALPPPEPQIWHLPSQVRLPHYPVPFPKARPVVLRRCQTSSLLHCASSVGTAVRKKGSALHVCRHPTQSKTRSWRVYQWTLGCGRISQVEFITFFSPTNGQHVFRNRGWK